MENQNHAPDTASVVTPSPATSPPARFRAGKLIMISPKHKEPFVKRPQSISFTMYKELRGANIPEYYRRNKTKFKWNGFDDEVDFFLQPLGHLPPGVPVLLLDEPKEVTFVDFNPERDKNLYMAARQQANVRPVRGWQIRFMLTDKVTGQITMGHAIVSNKIWKHYLCVVVPRRAEKYGIE